MTLPLAGNVINNDYDIFPTDMKTKTILTVSLIAGVILLMTGTSITSIVKMVYADPNPDNNGQNFAPGQNFGSDLHRNPSDGAPPPGQAPNGLGNQGQCLKNFVFDDFCRSS
jgi:hypothetical protein